jgi:hypothetical protein
MNKLIAPALVAIALAATGCGAIFNKSTVQAQTAQGVAVDGQSGYVMLDQSTPHTVQYANGGMCVIPSGMSVGYLLLDLFLTFPIGIIVDAVTGDWNVLENGCPGVMILD